MALTQIDPELLIAEAENDRDEAVRQAESHYRKTMESVAWLTSKGRPLQADDSTLLEANRVPATQLSTEEDDDQSGSYHHDDAGEDEDDEDDLEDGGRLNYGQKTNLIRDAAQALRRGFSTQNLHVKVREMYPDSKITMKAVLSAAYQLRLRNELARVQKRTGSDPDIYSLPQEVNGQHSALHLRHEPPD